MQERYHTYNDRTLFLKIFFMYKKVRKSDRRGRVESRRSQDKERPGKKEGTENLFIYNPFILQIFPIAIDIKNMKANLHVRIFTYRLS